MQRLIVCLCGHTIDEHGSAGCGARESSTASPCVCDKREYQVLDEAIQRIAEQTSPSEVLRETPTESNAHKS